MCIRDSYSASLSSAITKHLEAIDARLRAIEGTRYTASAEVGEMGQAVIDLTDSEQTAPDGWQFERRQTRAQRQANSRE